MISTIFCLLGIPVGNCEEAWAVSIGLACLGGGDPLVGVVHSDDNPESMPGSSATRRISGTRGGVAVPDDVAAGLPARMGIPLRRFAPFGPSLLVTGVDAIVFFLYVFWGEEIWVFAFIAARAGQDDVGSWCNILGFSVMARKSLMTFAISRKRCRLISSWWSLLDRKNNEE